MLDVAFTLTFYKANVFVCMGVYVLFMLGVYMRGVCFPLTP